ncbi:MAG TPA: type II secretion system F family protein [Acidimicrobiales bacterium]|jgi:Flp pilus assembly protein TadB|nr:type II secretion system F family protein [Acidimicrobiales bacterium]
MESASGKGLFGHPRWVALTPSLSVTGTSPAQLASRVVAAAGTGLLAPPVIWAAAEAAGISMPAVLPILLALLLIPIGAGLPIALLKADAKDRRQHFRTVIGTYVDLVVLSLAGGAGIEESLLAASSVSSDWAARRISKALLLARDAGESAWEALSGLGHELDLPELIELSATLQLAGTEGARVRQSLSARAVSLRRHEQAEAESSANAMTERLFLPGTLLLLGFLLFIGYPAFSRILTGF